MNWNIAAECISTVILCIIWIYSRKGNPIPNIKNRLFQLSFATTFCAMFANILSTYLIFTLNQYTLALTWGVTLVYFIATPLMGMVYYFYTLSNIFEGDPHIGRYFLLSAIPGMAYVVMVLLTPLTQDVFGLSVSGGYIQGKYIMSTYVVFYLYCFLCVFMVLINRKRITASIRIILYTFPVVAVIVIVFQMFVPSIVLTGSAATCAMLLIYLYLQNKQLSIDHLTHIPNRQEFLKMLELSLKKKSELVVVVLSLRDFKLINDTYGQHNGDKLLTAVSNYLRKELGLKEGELYRYSGDEFAVILKESDYETIASLIERIESRMTQPWDVTSCTCLLSVATGVVAYPQTTDQMEGLINGIECAITLAKKDDANRHLCYCTPALLEKARRRLFITDLLKQHLEAKCFEIYYQPILKIETHCFVMAEALLRMNNTPLGSISPGEFIPIAEESGLIVDITYLVLEKVCRYIRHLLDAGVPLRSVSVNFSALQFTQKDLIPRMKEIVRKCDVPFSMIKIEITESTLAENVEIVSDYMHQMHELGLRIGLDDFGTGYSNLISVLDLPIDTVKLDKSLIWSAVKHERFSIAVHNFARAFRELGMIVLAEGVETEQQSRFVESCGCSLIQGFLYARPMPPAVFEPFIVEQNARQQSLSH